jgi:hypothetical protein
VLIFAALERADPLGRFQRNLVDPRFCHFKFDARKENTYGL